MVVWVGVSGILKRNASGSWKGLLTLGSAQKHPIQQSKWRGVRLAETSGCERIMTTKKCKRSRGRQRMSGGYSQLLPVKSLKEDLLVSYFPPDADPSP